MWPVHFKTKNEKNKKENGLMPEISLHDCTIHPKQRLETIIYTFHALEHCKNFILEGPT